jgi:hypothetical protein
VDWWWDQRPSAVCFWVSGFKAQESLLCSPGMKIFNQRRPRIQVSKIPNSALIFCQKSKLTLLRSFAKKELTLLFCADSQDEMDASADPVVAGIDLNHANLQETLVKERSLLTHVSVSPQVLNGNRFSAKDIYIYIFFDSLKRDEKNKKRPELCSFFDSLIDRLYRNGLRFL